MMLAWLSAVALAGDGWDWRATVAAEIDSAPTGVVEVGGRTGPWALELLTTHLRAAWQPSWQGGKAWISADVEPGTAGMYFKPWRDGVFATDEIVFAFAVGATGGAQLYLPHGLYVGVEGQSSWWTFVTPPGGTYDPPDRPFHTADAVLGFWRPWLQAWVRAGVDWTGGGVSPHVEGHLETHAPWIVRPLVLVDAGWASWTDDLSITRLGGNNPYFPRLAGAGFGELRAEDYGAFRGGVEGGRTEREVHTWSVHGAGDVVVFDGRVEVGFTVGGRYDNRGRFVEAAWGWAPWLPRPGGTAMSGWLAAGLTWGKGWGPR